MRILVLGASGMLGHKLVQVLGRRFEIFASIRGDFDRVEHFGILERNRTFENVDVRNFETVETLIRECRPDVVVNSLGIVKQRLESRAVVQMLEINSLFPHRLTELALRDGFRLITISTDCVFSGTKGRYTETDPADALDLYGQSKHWGEVDQGRCLTIRTSIIGRELFDFHGLFEWLISKRGESVQGFANAVFSGFPTLVFADIIGDIAENHQELSGVFHVSSEPISKFELLKKLNAKFELGISIDMHTDLAIDRTLDNTKFREATGFKPPNWDEMIDAMAADETPYEKWDTHRN